MWYVFRQSLRVDQIKQIIGTGFLMFWSQLLQLHLLSMICIIVRTDVPVIDFFLHIVLTLLAKSVLGVVCWAIVCHYRPLFDRIHGKIFRSLARKKPTFNKTVVLGLLSVYATLALHIAQPSVTAMSLALLQNFICYLLTDTYHFCTFYSSEIRTFGIRKCIVCYRCLWSNVEVTEEFATSTEDLHADHFMGPPEGDREEENQVVSTVVHRRGWKRRIRRSSSKFVKSAFKKLNFIK